MRSASFNTLFEKPEIDASFTVQRGNLAGFDLPRALQQRSREGVQGGKTRFEELSGIMQSKDGRHQFRSVKVQAGILKATGQLDISPSAEVSGRVQSELRSSAGAVRGSFSISGNSQAILLKP
ncbi:MAG: hypothetical protein FJY37_06450 [Betaproteobacteria bacterium]|nr:hypothetical protein [Betaproteobacteria bacterium]